MKELQINQEIREREVRVVGADGEQLGVMPTRDAMALAEQKEVDLVNISPTAKPPVCKLVDYGKYKFELIKKEKELKKKQKTTELKEVWLSMTIEENDLNVKAKQAIKFLKNGDKVKVSIRMRGRQAAYAVQGVEVMNTFFEIVKEVGVIEKRPLTEGRNILMILAPVK